MKFKGSITGASFIIAGTSIGGGMLAIPLIAEDLGFVLSSLLILATWLVTILAAHLLLHINMACPEHSNLSTMAKETIGKVGSVLTWTVYLLLLYSLLVAYMMGGSSLLGHTMKYMLHFETPELIRTLVFTAVLGAFVYFGARSVDYMNRVLLTVKLSAFFLMVAMLLPHIRLSALTPVPLNAKSWIITLPVMINAFGYQIVIPALRDYLHSNVKKIKRVIWIGGTIPFVVYLLWVAVIFGLLPHLTSQDDLSTMISRLETRVKIPLIGWIITFFTDIAVTTSFLGVSMSLFHFIRDGFGLNRNRLSEKCLGVLITFVPPICFTLAFPKGFLEALSYGGVFTVILQMIIPVWMDYQAKKKKMKSGYPFKLHWTGIVLILSISFLTIGSQIFYHK